MPELPEVEIVKRQLSQYFAGHIIEGIDVLGPQVVRGDLKSLVGGSPIGFVRRGKGLLIHFDNGHSLAVHLKMTGQIIYRAAEWQSGRVAEKYKLSKKVGELPGKHTRVVFHLRKIRDPHTFRDKRSAQDDKGEKAYLYYNDIRKFGWLHVLPTAELRKITFFSNLGPEPSEIIFDKFYKILSASRMPVKNFIMDQRRIAGVGNIYANDALWKAKIDPRRAANSISKEEAKKLLEAIRSVIVKGIEEGAASDNTYVDALGQEGGYQNHFLVYHREGEKCLRCGNTIKKFTLGGRGTFWCPMCQK